jgi:hypothetical protein
MQHLSRGRQSIGDQNWDMRGSGIGRGRKLSTAGYFGGYSSAAGSKVLISRDFREAAAAGLFCHSRLFVMLIGKKRISKTS